MRIAIVLALLCAGCASTPMTAPAEPQLLYVGEGTDCAETVLIVPRPLDELAAHVPDGWRPIDASGVFGVPIPSGQGIVGLAAFSCDAGGPLVMGEAAIAVAPPATDRAPADVDFYSLAMVGRDHAMLRAAAAAGFSAGIGNATVDADVNGGATIDGPSLRATWRGTGLAEQAFTSTTRYWHETPTGLAMIEYRVDVQVFVGPAATCTLAGEAADAAGFTSCRPGDALVMQIPDFGGQLPIEVWSLPTPS